MTQDSQTPGALVPGTTTATALDEGTLQALDWYARTCRASPRSVWNWTICARATCRSVPRSGHAHRSVLQPVAGPGAQS